MAKQIMAIISLSVFAALAFVAYKSWSRRSKAQTLEFGEPQEALEFFGELLAQARCLYVATTYAANHLERISAYGLGARGNANVLVFTEGLLIVRTGERPLAIDRSQIHAVEFTQVAIDKAVEPDGLLSLSWNQDGTELATQLRIVDSRERADVSGAIADIISSNIKREVNK